jgi:hypothetical protein
MLNTLKKVRTIELKNYESELVVLFPWSIVTKDSPYLRIWPAFCASLDGEIPVNFIPIL